MCNINATLNVFKLTSVGQKYFQRSILQQIASGEHGSDLCEQPFSMKAFCIG